MYKHDMSFWDAVYHKNLDEGEMVEVAAVAGGATAVAVTAGPAVVTMAGQGMMGAGMATGSTTVFGAGMSTTAAGGTIAASLYGIDQATQTGGASNWYDAMNKGNRMHYDQLNGSDGAFGPSQLQEMYPKTEFYFARRGEAGVDVTYLDGMHPSAYPNSSWPAGVNYADIKPNTVSGCQTFYYEISIGKLPEGAIPIPYNPDTMQIEPWHAFYSYWSGPQPQ